MICKSHGREKPSGTRARDCEIFNQTLIIAHGRHARVALWLTLLDLAEVSFIFVHIVGEGKHELLGVLRRHDDTAYHRSLRHTRSGEDEIDDKLIGAVAYHGEIRVFSVCHFRL